ncbi:hypothetical protein L484_016006 [Morus notabilis]|uniref:Uncharacterized protein n=1 Tax=Morus notabilis TaxID=981085 RepID=W9QZH7_9ROSA|nr:hypothetical protein L484_016006 [Morus notabilis]
MNHYLEQNSRLADQGEKKVHINYVTKARLVAVQKEGLRDYTLIQISGCLLLSFAISRSVLLRNKPTTVNNLLRIIQGENKRAFNGLFKQAEEALERSNTLRAIWLERKNQIFEDLEGDVNVVWDRVKFCVALWLYQVKRFHAFSFSDFPRSWDLVLH